MRASRGVARRRPSTARGRAARLALSGLVAVAVAGRARAADVELPGARGTRDVSTLTAREAVLVDQADAARATARWRLRALHRLVVGGDALDGATRARALDAGTRAFSRELAEAQSLARERDQLRLEREALAASADHEESIGAPPAITLPVAGPVVGRFGVAPERASGLLVARAGVRLAAAPGGAVRAPAAGVVVRLASEPEGATVVLDAGAGWTAIVGGLAETSVAAGARVAAGERLGAAAAGAAPAIGFEVWRGRHPVDPLLLLRAAPTAREATKTEPPKTEPTKTEPPHTEPARTEAAEALAAPAPVP